MRPSSVRAYEERLGGGRPRGLRPAGRPPSPASEGDGSAPTRGHRKVGVGVVPYAKRRSVALRALGRCLAHSGLL